MLQALLEYRNTPLDKNMPSPAKLLYGRKIKGIVPVNDKLLLPYHQFENYSKQLTAKQDKQKAYFDQHAKDLPDNLNKNDVVVQNEMKEWEPGIIINKSSSRPRSYDIKLNRSENVINRNRKYIKKIHRDNFIQPDNNLFNELLENRLDKTTDHDKKTDSGRKIKLDINTKHDFSKTGKIIEDSECESVREERRTKSGRIIKRPDYLKDYISY